MLHPRQPSSCQWPPSNNHPHNRGTPHHEPVKGRRPLGLFPVFDHGKPWGRQALRILDALRTFVRSNQAAEVS